MAFMVDEVHTIRSVNWRDIFPFAVIFRTFRVAIHPSKLVLALVALLIVYFGGTLMDALTPASQQAVVGELTLYEEGASHLDHDLYYKQLREEQISEQQESLQAQLQAIGKPKGSIDDLKWRVHQDLEAAVASAHSIDDRQQAYAVAQSRMGLLDDYRVGLFRSFGTYELGQGYVIVHSVRNENFLGPGGVTASLLRMFAIAPGWALKYHPIFFAIYGLFFLVIWSVFGGAITRIAAVHFARDEKISVRQALAFSTSKFLSFVSAPIIPMLIVVIIGILVTAGGLVVNIPFIGPIIVGALYVLVMAAAFVMTLVLIGLLGGFNLMYPTIAVEGSDSFDAISRSFSYLYARPWRLGFYTLIALGYGALTDLFVRYFLYIMLSLANIFTGLGVFTRADSQTPLWQTMWPSPGSIGRLAYSINWISLSLGERIGAVLLAFWVYLVVALLGAYAISFYFSVNTVIYYLMRREVDATELDDVYLEQSDEDFGDVVPKSETSIEGGPPVVVTPPANSPAMAVDPIPPIGPVA